MINYYCDHIPRHAHLRAPLTAQTKDKKHLVHWDDTCELNFKTMLAYPNHKYPFVIELDASDYQLGASILQITKDMLLSIDEIIALFLAALDKLPDNFRPIAYFSRSEKLYYLGKGTSFHCRNSCHLSLCSSWIAHNCLRGPL
jgi:hypothetical protein